MKTPILIAGLCLALAACATTGRLSSTEKLDLYRAHAGAPQNDMQFFGSLNGWTELGDSALAVWTRPSEAYLLELSGPCPDLSYATAIGLTSSMGRVSSRFDKVLVRDPTGGPRMPCFINSIRKLDVKALRTSEQELRQAQVQEREEATAPAK
ncbi:TPA: hypothetical protein QDZ75_002867 [Stenotrophomonas maltophilia]|uniref:Lipoprotein n=1 Tax=Stenotrophomonas maltophilia TaxID=40324 RepID=A0A2J0U944_STEMA|nr:MULTISPECIES: DUF6491 family protein [Stenotrophomonas]PJL25855.1 hypothetical protein B9Y64_15110 [Stenotrophomonas maltophilia]HDS1138816.1 hypothetical protein [Stenotrophomonas maltophilia]HDS1147445.1 hypothetical protein [Stenotrophomonas maltophilia]HDS1163412.1 hypothetical protein [Stenotrophomonas maltophilia]HEL5400711.1 hypothetical protein [Stenotrophomonas maltophilia]